MDLVRELHTENAARRPDDTERDGWAAPHGGTIRFLDLFEQSTRDQIRRDLRDRAGADPDIAGDLGTGGPPSRTHMLEYLLPQRFRLAIVTAQERAAPLGHKRIATRI